MKAFQSNAVLDKQQKRRRFRSDDKAWENCLKWPALHLRVYKNCFKIYFYCLQLVGICCLLVPLLPQELSCLFLFVPGTHTAVCLDEELSERVSLSYYATPIFNLYSKTVILIMSSYQKLILILER